METFPALLFTGPTAVGQAVSVQATAGGLIIAWDGESLRLDYATLSAELGGLEGNQLVLKTRSSSHTLFVADATVASRLREQLPSGPLQDDLTLLQQQWQRHRRRRGPLIVGSILAVLVFWVGAYQAFLLTRDFLVDRVPVSWEQKIGKVLLNDAISAGRLYQDPVVVEPVLELGRRLAGALPDPAYAFHFQVVASEDVNAFALPGGEMVIYTGLIQAAESPEELAGVMAHEIQHVVYRHSLKRIVGRLGIIAGATLFFGDTGGLISTVAEAGSELLALRFDRAQESEADAAGARLMHKARIDPRGMLRFFARLAAKENQVQTMLSFASTHPASQERVRELEVLIKELPALDQDKPLMPQWQAIKGAIAALQQKSGAPQPGF